MTLPGRATYLKEHYVYELNMLRLTNEHIKAATEQVLKNVLIESFCVHARTLIDFYNNKHLMIGSETVLRATS